MNNLLSLATEIWLPQFEENEFWEVSAVTALQSKNDLYVGFRTGKDPDAALQNVIQFLWSQETARRALAEHSGVTEVREDAERRLRMVFLPHEPIYVGAPSATIGKNIDLRSMRQGLEGRIGGFVEETLVARQRRNKDFLSLSEEDRRRDYAVLDKAEREALKEERKRLSDLIAEVATNPGTTRHGGFVVFSPSEGRFVDFLTRSKYDGQGSGMESVFNGKANLVSGKESDAIGRTGKETLSFLKGLFVLVWSGGEEELTDNVIYSEFMPRHVADDGIVLTVFGSAAAAEKFQAYIIKSWNDESDPTFVAFEAAKVTEITDELIRGFGELYISSHMQ